MNNSIATVELVRKAKEGDIRAFKKIYLIFFDRTMATALTLLKDEGWAEDAVQEVFVKVWDNRLKLNCESDIWFYIYVLTRNHCISKLRAIKKDKQLIDQLFVGVQHQFSLQEDISREKELERTLTNLKSQLSPQQRLVFELCKEEGLSYVEVASKLNISKNTVKNHMVNSLKIVKNFLNRETFYLLLYFFY